MARGRKSAEQRQHEQRRSVMDEIESLALEGAPAAMRTLVKAAGGGVVKREELQAAMYLLNQVWGKPADKEPHDDKYDAVRALFAEIREERRRNLRAQQAGGGPVVGTPQPAV